mmetsp:Transcript_22798/g.63603  ORF Transcript_22798/g.63603 Transcript_22798/m.63603 type:complete len:160 (-) Transcript_22798:1476-1955(-)
MKSFTLPSLVKFLLVALVVASPAKMVAGSGEDDGGFFSFFKEKYDGLPESGKFATGAAIGFGGSRVAVNSAVGVVKFAGAAFVASEVLNAAGLLDDIPSFSDEQVQLAESMKRRALKTAQGFRQKVRDSVNPAKVQSFLETDKMAAMGLAAGAFVGFVV